MGCGDAVPRPPKTRRRSQHSKVDNALHFATFNYVTRQTISHGQSTEPKPILIGSQRYYETKEVIRMLKVSRQTLWTWRKGNFIPVGSRYRNRVVFSEVDYAAITAYAAKLEPVELSDSRSQMKLKLT